MTNKIPGSNPRNEVEKAFWGCRDLNSDYQNPNLEVCQVSVQPRITITLT